MRTLIALVGIALLASPTKATETIDWSGFYAGIVVGAGTGSPVDVFGGAQNSGTHPFDHSSPALGIFGGHNWNAGDAIVGLEFSALADTGPELIYGFGRPRIQETTYPNVLSSSYSSAPPTGSPTSGSMAGTIPGGEQLIFQVYDVTIRELAAPMLSARVGQPVGQAMIYGRFGAGASILLQRETDDRSRSVLCTETATRTDYNQNGSITYATGCIGPYSGEVKIVDELVINPAVEVGIGIEMKLAQILLRTEAQAKYVFTRNAPSAFSENFTTIRLFAGAGLKL